MLNKNLLFFFKNLFFLSLFFLNNHLFGFFSQYFTVHIDLYMYLSISISFICYFVETFSFRMYLLKFNVPLALRRFIPRHKNSLGKKIC